MNKQRIEAQWNLIQELLNCPSGEEAQDSRTDAISGRGARPCAPTDGGSKVNLRKS